MNKEEIIGLTEKWLESVPDIRKRIKLIDTSLEDDICNVSNTDKLKKERKRLNAKLSIIINAVGTLDEENQRIICYDFFDKIPDRVTALRIGYSKATIPRRIKKNLLDIGRMMFGFEDEFWKEVMEAFGDPRNIGENLFFKVMKRGCINE